MAQELQPAAPLQLLAAGASRQMIRAESGQNTFYYRVRQGSGRTTGLIRGLIGLGWVGGEQRATLCSRSWGGRGVPSAPLLATAVRLCCQCLRGAVLCFDESEAGSAVLSRCPDSKCRPISRKPGEFSMFRSLESPSRATLAPIKSHSRTGRCLRRV